MRGGAVWPRGEISDRSATSGVGPSLMLSLSPQPCAYDLHRVTCGGSVWGDDPVRSVERDRVRAEGADERAGCEVVQHEPMPGERNAQALRCRAQD